MDTLTANASVERFVHIQEAFREMPERFPEALAEGYERILRKIDTLWGSYEAVRYLDSLLLPDRTDRHGFSPQVLHELGDLKQVHEYLYPELSRNPFDPFSSRKELLDLEPAEIGQGEGGAAAETGEGGSSGHHEQGGEPSGYVPVIEPPSPWPEIRDIEELRRVVASRRQGSWLPEKDSRRLGEILLERQLITVTNLETALTLQKSELGRHDPLGLVLLKMRALAEADLIRALCHQSGVLLVDLRAIHITHEAMRLVPIEVARTKEAVPVADLDGTLFLAVENPLVFREREYFSFLTNRNVELVCAAKAKLLHRLNVYGQAKTAKEADEDFRRLAGRALNNLPRSQREAGVVAPSKGEEDETVVGLVNRMIDDAVAQSASDIHLEAYPGCGDTRIRFRRDGRMEAYSDFPSAYHEAVVARVKIMADLDISEKRRPQDGKISYFRPAQARLDLRVATIPTMRGIEDVTIRLLPVGEPMPLELLGMDASVLKGMRELMARPYGLILVCGPTGSGKTTTLHSVLRELNTPDRKIWTAEDPVEIVQKDICQVQVNSRIGWTFASALRSFLRADPDVIMIGEMRDQETAKIALEASMTGHLVLSTLHTNSAAETVARLLDLGVDPFNLSDALLGVFAQRLARRLCSSCARRHVLEQAELDELATEYHYSAHACVPSLRQRESIFQHWRQQLGQEELALWEPGEGCGECGGKGHRGRLGLFELMVVSPEIRGLVRDQAAASAFQRCSIGAGMLTLKQDGIEKALRGLTDMHEVRSACI